jgi:hypothetical protein
VALALPASAQVTLDEIDTAAEAKDAEMTAFRERLNSPDPDRALVALELLITKGDSAQRRMAVRFGLQSTDRAIRATTLRAILDSEPTLLARFDPVSEEVNGYYGQNISNAGGVIDAEGNGSVTFKVNGFDPENDCWTSGRNRGCVVRIRSDAVSLWFGGSWGSYDLDSSGQLVGEQSVGGNLAKGIIDLSE